MKRKLEDVDNYEEQRFKTQDYKTFSTLQKRKGVQLQQPNAKRFHMYNRTEEQDRYIGQLEHVVKQLMLKVKELEYQLEMNRNANDCLKINYVESY